MSFFLSSSRLLLLFSCSFPLFPSLPFSLFFLLPPAVYLSFHHDRSLPPSFPLSSPSLTLPIHLFIPPHSHFFLLYISTPHSLSLLLPLSLPLSLSLTFPIPLFIPPILPASSPLHFENPILQILLKRNLKNWNYVEHFDSNIFQQVLRDALYTLPYCEKYYHHRSNCFYIMLYNPCNVEHWNKESWSIQLHSNVGFRNYMLHVAANIQDWIHEEEKKYDALLNSLRVQKMKEQEMAIAEAALTEQLAEKAPKDGKKTPNKKAARAQSKSPTRYESIFASDGEFIRQGSLKSLKQEEELMKLEEEEKEKKKGQKTPKKLDKSAEKEPKTSPVMGQKTNRSVKSGKEDSCTELTPMTEVADEKELPFTGYDVGNNIISLTASKYTLFPSDGAQIRIETTEYLYGYQSVKCSVLKNGHVFTVHLLNPKDLEENEHLSETKAKTSPSELNENVVPALFVGDEEEKFKKAPSYRERFSTIENVEKETDSLEQASEVFSEIVYSDFGSISAVLSDGIILSFSKFGPTGYHSLISENKTSLTDSPKPGTPSVPSPRDTPSGHGKKKMKHFDSSETLKVSDEIKEFEPEVKMSTIEPTVPQQPTFQNLYITCPDGLKIEYFLEYSYGIEPVSPDHHRILVKQSYPFRNHGVQSCESTRNKHAYQEQHRIIVSDGTVIKKMKDGTFEVLYVDGTVAKLECVSSDKSFAEFNTASSSCVTGGKKASIPEKLPLAPIVQPDEKDLKQEKWTITYPSGQKFILTPDGKKVNLPRVLFSMKSDIKSGQTILTRDDHVILVSETTGKTIVEHEDGTRITSYYEEMTSPVQRDCGIEGMESSDEPCKKMFIMVECPSYATVKFNSKTSENLTLLANGTLINVFPDGYYSLLLAGENAGDRLYLDLDGTLTYTSPLSNNLADDTNQPETFYTFKHNAPTICETVDPDGITFKVDHKGHHEIIKESSDNNVTEKFIRVEEPPQITEYKRHAPRIFFLLPDGSGGEIHPGETIDNYLNWSKQDPACIILKDMFQDQPGIYGITLLKPYKPFPDSWLSQYELESIIPESIRLQTAINPDKIKSDSVKCPDILEIRQFTQYPLVNEEGRESIQQGLSDYIEYCFNRCSRTIESQVLDNRSEEEKKLADVLQENVKKFDLKEQLRPQLKISDVKQLYQQGITRNQTLPVIEQKQKESQNVPNIEKMQKDNLEEEMAKKALRNQEIPNYFDSMFGKAFLETQQIKTLDGKLKKLSNFPVLQTNPVKHNNIDVKTGPATHQRYMTPLSRNSYIGTYSSEIEHEYEVSHQLRPVNPSPSHATGNASPNTVRPTNPTPNLQKTEPTQERPAADSSSTPSYPGTGKNRHPDVTGKYHSQDIRLPISLVGGRPNAIPNQKFQTIEEPVRRQIRNSIMKGSTSESQWRLKMMRGMNLYPEEINFGVLREGNSYMMTVYLINTGVDSCHFKIKQPPPATGLKVIYKPGSVAAGLKRKLFLELFAIAVGADQDTGVGTIRHNLCITTETDILHLPIQATILTGFEYDRQKDENQLDPKSTSAQLISTQGKQGLIRPPKRSISKGQLRQ
ncbi:Sperm-associated antigen 17 [Acanthosepion pharaonis]|uniref:Sperm-associated antigen 17 n=1 Tax=Acanthosepion pharaonis TaxID=158019 RepID=A0A812BNK3_ACAPH|nr:Sperm-associated antigen 17 [Sepia pharaonis]